MTDLAQSPALETSDTFETADVSRRYNQGLTPLNPSQKTVIRIQMAICGLLLVITATIADYVLQAQAGMPLGMLGGPVIIVALLMIFVLPRRIYRRWGYDMGAEQLRILRGFLWRIDTIVPFNRIQHIDVVQGPIQRIFGLSTLIVHTAGTHNNIVSLRGLATADAEDMRETIKGQIRQDMI